jgi:hypothetical protein
MPFMIADDFHSLLKIRLEEVKLPLQTSGADSERRDLIVITIPDLHRCDGVMDLV